MPLADPPLPAVTALVLRNKGVPVTVYRTQLVTDTNDDGEIVQEWRPVPVDLNSVDADKAEDAAGTYEQQTRHLRFDSNAFATLEEAFDGLAALETMMQTKPYQTVRVALAIAWKWPEERAGAAMLPSGVQEYSTAIGVALAIANGADPTQAAEMLAIGFKAVADQKVKMGEEMEAMLAAERAAAPSKPKKTATAKSPGTNGSPSGSEPVAATKSSGG